MAADVMFADEQREFTRKRTSPTPGPRTLVIIVCSVRSFVKVRHNDYDRAPLDHLSNDDIDRFYEHHNALAKIIRCCPYPIARPCYYDRRCTAGLRWGGLCTASDSMYPVINHEFW